MRTHGLSSLQTVLSIARARSVVNVIRVLLICNVFASPKNDFLFAAPYANNFLNVGFETQLLGIIRNGTQANF